MKQDDGTPIGGNQAELDCAGARERLFDFLDRELGPEVEAMIQAHLEKCGHCFREADFERRFLETLQAARDADVCPAKLRSRVREALRRDGWAEPAGS